MICPNPASGFACLLVATPLAWAADPYAGASLALLPAGLATVGGLRARRGSRRET